MHLSRRLSLLVVLSLALALGACGGGIADKPAADVLKETFGPGKSITSGQLDLRIAFDGEGLQGIDGPVKLGLTGPFASTGKGKVPRFDLDAKIDISGQSVAAGAVSTGDKAFVSFAGSNFAVDEASFAEFAKSYADDQKKAAGRQDSGPLGLDPISWLADPKNVGTEDIGGTETVHVTSKVDVPKFLQGINEILGRADATGAAAAAGAGTVPSKLTPAQVKQIEEAVKSTSLDVYSGKDDGILRRLNIQVAYDVPSASRQASGGLTTGTLGFDLVFKALNEEQDIQAPKDARPLSDLTGGQAGATGAGGASAAPPAGSASPSQLDPDSPQGKYAACLEQAGQSIAEAQKCAPLLGG